MMVLGDTGMLYPVGLNAAAACAAMRAGVANFQELPYWDQDNSTIVGAAIPGLSFDIQFGARLVEMLSLALRECLSKIPELHIERVPLFVGWTRAPRWRS